MPQVKTAAWRSYGMRPPPMHADIQNDGTINATETISSDTDVLSAGKSGAHHTHTGVQPGSGNTGQTQ